MKTVLLKFLSTVTKYRMIEESERIVAAVSGGPDSVCMLYVLTRFQKRLGIDKIAVAHVNYRKRGEDSDLDQEFVEKLSRYLGLDVFVKEVSPGYFNRVKRENFQKVAREIRYRFFREVSENIDAAKIAVAHTIDDQAETVFMRFLAGQGLKGLKGIPPKTDDRIIRPLIEISRGEIVDFLKSESLGYRIDKTNFEGQYERNRIRNEVFPNLEKLTGRDVKKKIYDTGEIFRQIDDLIDTVTEGALNESFSPGNKELDIKKYCTYPELIRKSVIQSIGYKHLGRELNSRVIEKADSLLLRDIPSFSMDFPGNYVLTRSYKSAKFSTQKDIEEKPFAITIEKPGEYSIGDDEGRVHVSLVEISDIKPILERIIKDKNVSAFDGTEDFFPIQVRNFNEGDRITPFGMKNRKKLKKIFMERRIPREIRKSLPVFLLNDEIVWVPGVIRGSRSPIDSKSNRIIVLEYKGK